MTEDDRLMDQRVQIIADRTKRIFLNALSFWATKMRHQNRFRTVLAQIVNGRQALADAREPADRKSTRLNSSHSQISYAVFCLKKKQPKRRTRAVQPRMHR